MKKKILYIIIISLFAFILFYNNLTTTTSTNNLFGNNLLVHFIDVGQGDSILIQASNKNVLIDSGSNSYSKKVINYINNLNIKTLDYVISTHPHEDHMGSMDDIIKYFEIGEFYAPKITSNTEDFLSMVRELYKKRKKINVAKAGLIIPLENNTYLKFLSPSLNKYDNLNNYSTVIKLQNNNNSFLFTGDGEKLVEEELLRTNDNVSCNVLKVGHHGSKTSTSKEFLMKASPQYAVISCGMGNDYGHPDKNVLESLKKISTTTFRTDKNGTIVFSSNEKGISVIYEKK
ncbi:ComEC/Rec2 family competence protein [Clostridium sp.]|uniref:ComEC/Rec2 family competence protein n=1 Tax=Clostridium sp. TaxID=1506 RepID=UPI002FC7529E